MQPSDLVITLLVLDSKFIVFSVMTNNNKLDHEISIESDYFSKFTSLFYVDSIMSYLQNLSESWNMISYNQR